MVLVYSISVAINAITLAAGTNNTWARMVPSILPIIINITVVLKADSLILPSMTSSVIMDKWGSIKTNRMMVAMPVITELSVIAVVLNSGPITPAYKADRTPTDKSDTANMFSIVILYGI